MGIGRGCSDWGLLEDEELRNSCGGFSDSVAPLRAEDGCLETLPDVQREVKHSILPKHDRSLSPDGSECVVGLVGWRTAPRFVSVSSGSPLR